MKTPKNNLKQTEMPTRNTKATTKITKATTKITKSIKKSKATCITYL